MTAILKLSAPLGLVCWWLTLSLLAATTYAEHHHHVFLFRHCLRSTNPKINMYDADTVNGTQFPTNIADYINVSLPEWNTGLEWCTPKGSEHVKAVGQYIVQTLLQGLDLEISFITDDIDRDVTTSNDLVEGIKQGKGASQTIVGFDDLSFDPILFHPTKGIYNNDGDFVQLCETPDPNTVSNDITERLQNIVKPPLDLTEAKTLIENNAGVGSAGSLSDLWVGQGDFNTPTVNTDLTRVKGPVNIIALIAEMVFYAKASDTEFLPNLSLEEIMGLLAWEYWLRSVADINNLHAAMRGVVMMHRIFQLLQHEDEGTPEKEAHGHHVTFIVGHDGNLDSIATALNMQWELPEPYPSSIRSASSDEPANEREWYATPPASAIYFKHSDTDADGASVDVSVLTPILLKQDPINDAVVADRSGTLVEVPVIFQPVSGFESFNNNVSSAGNATRVSGTDPLGLLHQHLVDIATNVYPQQAINCLTAAISYYPDDNPNNTTEPVSSNTTSAAPSTSSSPSASPMAAAIPATSSPTVGPTSRPTTPAKPPMAPPTAPSPPVAAPSFWDTPAPIGAPKPPTHAPHHPTFNNNNSGGGSDQNYNIVAFVVVGVVLGGLLFLLRRPIQRALGLGGRPVHYSGMDGGAHDLDFSVEMI